MNKIWLVPKPWITNLKERFTLHKSRLGFYCYGCETSFKGGVHYVGGGKMEFKMREVFPKN